MRNQFRREPLPAAWSYKRRVVCGNAHEAGSHRTHWCSSADATIRVTLTRLAYTKSQPVTVVAVLRNVGTFDSQYVAPAGADPAWATTGAVQNAIGGVPERRLKVTADGENLAYSRLRQ